MSHLVKITFIYVVCHLTRPFKVVKKIPQKLSECVQGQ